MVLSAVTSGCGPSAMRINSSESDAVIRQRILLHTPAGTSGVDSLEWILRNLHCEQALQVYALYVDEVPEATDTGPGVARTNDRTIRAVVSTQSTRLVATRLTTVEWQFDAEDRLVDVTVDRQTLRPIVRGQPQHVPNRKACESN